MGFPTDPEHVPVSGRRPVSEVLRFTPSGS
jgi:hypothetical protein